MTIGWLVVSMPEPVIGWLVTTKLVVNIVNGTRAYSGYPASEPLWGLDSASLAVFSGPILSSAPPGWGLGMQSVPLLDQGFRGGEGIRWHEHHRKPRLGSDQPALN